MGETRVDLLHLLEDLRDAYPGTTEETILAEIVANAFDSGARTIALTTDAAARTLTIVDDGRGMRRRELARYHDIAASAKVRGETIGFAGVGIKIALLVSASVVTETRTPRQHVATAWGLASRHRAPWKWVPPPGMVGARGTAVRLTLDNGLSPLLDAGYLEAALRRHFGPLLTPALATFLSAWYSHGVRFVVNSRPVESEPSTRARLPPSAFESDASASRRRSAGSCVRRVRSARSGRVSRSAPSARSSSAAGTGSA
jgi:Histidine kinase-, DNA gyrase B-, and HSP90-like ATPase